VFEAVRTPTLPFPGYKWRWASVEPTIGLNSPPVFLGVLRAMKKHEGAGPGDAAFINELKEVKKATQTAVDLVRTPERNLIRNSGQYWKALGVLAGTEDGIRLTRFGKSVADRNTTKVEFATTVIKTLQLPNLRIESEPEKWQRAGLTIKPLELILSILVELNRDGGENKAYLTPEELIKIVIPLAGEGASPERHAEAIESHREGRLSVSRWPNCAPKLNDGKMAREFLIFLANYGICRKVEGTTWEKERYYLNALSPAEANRLVNLPQKSHRMDALKEIEESDISFFAERRKVMMEVLLRPQQPRFRRNILIAYKSKCAITGEKLRDVLEAAHIRPVADQGSDRVSNGFCFRTDIHTLFDAGHLQINPQGMIRLSTRASHSRSYRDIPDRIAIPSFVDKKNVEWRWMYY
jgi:hypothetical protein